MKTLWRRVLIPGMLLWSLPGLSEAQDMDPRSLDLVAMIGGRFGATPAFGAGIIFARQKDRFYVVTANHVVRAGGADAGDLHIRVRWLPNRDLKATLLPQNDRELDLAVLAVDGLSAQGVDVCRPILDRVMEPERVKRGLSVFPVGNPNGVGWAMPVRPDAISEASGGMVVFQSTPIARGHSGGALLSDTGKLIAMIQADEPPYGRALSIGKISELLKSWKLPVQLRERPGNGASPLFDAVGREDLEEARALLGEACTDVNAIVQTTDYDRTPLQMAAASGRLNMVKLLVDAGAQVNHQGDRPTPLDFAAERGDAAMAEFLIAHGAKCCDGPLATAVENGRVEAAKVLLAHGANPNQLFKAVGSDKSKPVYLELLALLIQAGADVNRKDEFGHTPLFTAVLAVKPGQVKLLLEGGADVTVKNGEQTSLLRNITYFSGTIKDFMEEVHEVTALLVKFSSTVEAGDGAQLLKKSAEEGWPDVTDLLIKRGVDVKGGAGYTALGTAVTHGYAEIVQLLLDAGASPNGARPTPLQAVLDHNDEKLLPAATRLEIVKMLVLNGAKVNLPTAAYPYGVFSEAPIYLALFIAKPRDLSLADFLISHGANLNITTATGTLLDFARDPGNGGLDAVPLLVQAGARGTR